MIDQFLDQIKDSKYDVTITTLRMDSSKTLESCIQAIRRHDLVLAHQKVQDHRLSKVRRLNVEDDNPEQQSTSTYIQPDVWYALSPEQRKAIMQARQQNPSNTSTNNPNAKNEKGNGEKESKKARRAKARAKAKGKKKQGEKAQDKDEKEDEE